MAVAAEVELDIAVEAGEVVAQELVLGLETAALALALKLVPGRALALALELVQEPAELVPEVGPGEVLEEVLEEEVLEEALVSQLLAERLAQEAVPEEAPVEVLRVLEPVLQEPGLGQEQELVDSEFQQDASPVPAQVGLKLVASASEVLVISEHLQLLFFSSDEVWETSQNQLSSRRASFPRFVS